MSVKSLEKKAPVPFDTLYLLRIVALLAALAGVTTVVMISGRFAPPTGTFRVGAKNSPAPDRFFLSLRQEANEQGAILTYSSSYPKWFYDRAEIGDQIVGRYCHFQLYRDDRWQAMYIPWQLLLASLMTLIWCLPLLLWLRRPKTPYSRMLLGLAMASELTSIACFLWLVGEASLRAK